MKRATRPQRLLDAIRRQHAFDTSGYFGDKPTLSVRRRLIGEHRRMLAVSRRRYLGEGPCGLRADAARKLSSAAGFRMAIQMERATEKRP